MAEFDSPWKEALDDFLQPFLALFAPGTERRIDWSVPPESLDNELAKLFPDGAIGPGVLDRLFKVRLRDGADVWVLIHIEVQARHERDFPERVFRYFYRLRDKFDLPLTCLVVLADESPTWRPDRYAYEFEGTRLDFAYPAVKLADFRDRIAELEASDNLFALIVLAHLQSQAARAPDDRLGWKRRITRNLLARGLDETRRWKVLRLVDWLLDLPLELNLAYWNEVREWKEGNAVPFETGLERMLKEKGVREGLLEGLEVSLDLKFGEAGKSFLEELKSVKDVAKLRAVQQAIRQVASVDDLRKLL